MIFQNQTSLMLAHDMYFRINDSDLPKISTSFRTVLVDVDASRSVFWSLIVFTPRLDNVLLGLEILR